MADFDIPPLNKRPMGLQEFFGIKSGTWGPRRFLPDMVPTLELWRSYVAANSEDLNGVVNLAGAITAGLTSVPFTTTTIGVQVQANSIVPSGEVWYLDDAAITGVLGAVAGGQINFLGVDCSDVVNNIIRRVPMQPIVPFPSVAGGQLGVGTYMLQPTWIRPGSTLAMLWSGIVPAASLFNTTFSARLVRLKF